MTDEELEKIGFQIVDWWWTDGTESQAGLCYLNRLKRGVEGAKEILKQEFEHSWNLTKHTTAIKNLRIFLGKDDL